MRASSIPPALGLLAVLAGAAGAETLEVKEFRLRKDAEEPVRIELRQTGLLQVRVSVKKPLANAPVQVTLEGPDGIQVEKQGAGPLRLRYALKNSERFGTWRVVVKNHAKMALLTGKVRIDFEPVEYAAEAAPAPPPPIGDDTDGKVLYPEEKAKIRAVCHGKNEDVFVRVDMDAGTGGYYMGYNRVFDLEASYRSDDLVELRGGGEPLLLDTAKKVLYFASGERGIFCKVRIYRGEP